MGFSTTWHFCFSIPSYRCLSKSHANNNGKSPTVQHKPNTFQYITLQTKALHLFPEVKNYSTKSRHKVYLIHVTRPDSFDCYNFLSSSVSRMSQAFQTQFLPRTFVYTFFLQKLVSSFLHHYHFNS